MFLKKYVSKKVKSKLEQKTSVAPTIYGLAKIHTQDVPLCPVVPNINTPGCKLSKFCNGIVQSLTDISVINSFSFKNILPTFKLNDGDVLFSLDVVSLDTNVNDSERIHLVLQNYDMNNDNTCIYEKLL